VADKPTANKPTSNTTSLLELIHWQAGAQAPNLTGKFFWKYTIKYEAHFHVLFGNNCFIVSLIPICSFKLGYRTSQTLYYVTH